MKQIHRGSKNKEVFIEEVINECDLLKANEELEVHSFGKRRDLKLCIKKDSEYNKEKDANGFNLVTIVTMQLSNIFMVVDDTEDTYVTDGSLYRELERIWNYKEFAIL